MKKFLVSLLLVGSSSAVAFEKPMPKFLEIAKKRLTRFEAREYCECADMDKERLGCETEYMAARLPHARELALLAMSRGAKGIVPRCERGSYDCDLISISNNGTMEGFWFDRTGYRRTTFDNQTDNTGMGINCYWSSSGTNNWPNTQLCFDGFYGTFRGLAVEVTAPFQCVLND